MRNEKITVVCPAKLNLSLDIVGVRDDGYHLMKMVMQSIDLCDEIIITKRNDDKIVIECDDKTIPTGKDNIIYKAAETFLKENGINNSGIEVQLKKRIPHGAGMGGGSSDAAGILVGLSKLFCKPLSTNQLIEMGKKIGADVPFCIAGSTALVEGIGEIITPLNPLVCCYFVVIKPNQSVNTKNAFKEFDEGKISYIVKTDEVLNAIKQNDIASLAFHMGNVFEQTVMLDCLHEIKSKLIEYQALNAMMTGSGSAIFGIFDDKSKALSCKEKLQLNGYQAFFAKPMNKGAYIL